MNKVLIIFSLVVIALIVSGKCQSDSGFLPCVACAREDKPVCAAPTKGGPNQSFESPCHVTSMDCGHKEHRNILQKKKFRKMTFQLFSEFTIIHDGPCKVAMVPTPVWKPSSFRWCFLKQTNWVGEIFSLIFECCYSISQLFYMFNPGFA